MDVAGNDIIRFLLIDRKDGPTQGAGHFAKQGELFFQSFGGFFAVCLILGMGRKAFLGNSPVKNHGSLGRVQIFDHPQKSGGKTVGGVRGFSLGICEGGDGVKAAVGVVVSVDKDHAHFFAALGSGGFLAEGSGGWRRHSIRGPLETSRRRRRRAG